MTEHEVPTPVQAVTDRIEARRTAHVRLPEAPPVDAGAPVCDGWGLVPVLASDGSRYEPAACLGCALCREVRPVSTFRSAQVMAALERDVMDEEPM
jgi:ferredoxin